ncbi:NAD(P)/FAD-dependent oxidoreductase [Sphingomonas sp. CROZ-RG-20F-R02-07]|uniref:flavin-containing monooxygenase n=1 Tax=Sphingomonas sp. CROZ-RG-20F-R02-07 TaxID=2914832 RepID=UPI001F57C1B3|nr:NAD(P)/FAD-dependent oxidoreductase [Sphingomonas sp. CROZ-RG-20F-R02-07]
MADQSDTNPASDILKTRERYLAERDKRSATDAGQRQYRDVEQGFAHLLDDPYGTAPARASVHDDVDVLVVGAGFGGMMVAARLRETGVAKVRIVDVASDVGGTWYWNRYPGAACDVESYIYFPLLEETGYMPVERYSKAAEIRAHTKRIAEHYDLYRDALFSTQVKSVDWDGAAARWTVRTDRGDVMSAQYVVLTTGPLNRPKLPEIPGLDDFAGHSFHTSRWDYAYTGGSATEPLSGLAGKRVGLIGTGATSIQCVPPLAASAQHLTVFQRTPSSVDARDNSPTDPAWAANLQPGWQQRRMENFTAQFTAQLPPHDEVRDGWTVLARAVREKLADNPQGLDPGTLLEQADFEKMAQIRERIGSIVEDPATAEALKPWFSLYCKRPCFSDLYLQAFNRPNVKLVETAGYGIDRITPDGVVVGDVEYPLDCLIFATGFETSTSYEKRSGMTIHGVGGRSLTDKWSGGVSTLHGMHTRGFPNLFVISQAQAGMSPNFPHMLSEQSLHLAHIVADCAAKGIGAIEPTEEAEGNWVETIVQMAEGRRKFIEACTPGYYNNEGRATGAAAKGSPFGAGPVEFVKLLRMWREQGDLAGMELDGEHARGTKEMTS